MQAGRGEPSAAASPGWTWRILDLGEYVKLRELISRIEELDAHRTIYAAGGTRAHPNSEAAALYDGGDGLPPPDAAGMDYVVEVDQALEVLDVWRAWRHGREPTLEEKCEAILHYARYDAFQPAAAD